MARADQELSPGDRQDPGEGIRSVAQLRMLHALAARLNKLTDVREIGEAIASELEALIDYHNCRVYELPPDSHTLYPIAFKGQLLEYEGETLEELITEVGEGLTGHVAESKKSYYAPNALYDKFAVAIPGTADVDESMLGVPLTYGDKLVGVIIVSKLGVDLFDDEDIRVLEVLGSHAAVAIENARLFTQEREAAVAATELVKLSQALTGIRDTQGVLEAALEAIPAMMNCHGVQAYLRDDESGDFLLAAGEMPLQPQPAEGAVVIPSAVAAPFLLSLQEPFILSREMIAAVPEEYRTVGTDGDGQVLVAPLRWEPDNFGALVIASGADGPDFTERDTGFCRGISDITSLALGNAARFQELEETSDRLKRLDDMKTMFLEAVSHDLRTPLSSVLGISLTLSRDNGELSKDDTKDLLNRLASNARKLETLLADLLDLDRLAKGIVEPNRRVTDVAALVGSVVEHTEALAGREVVLDIEPVSVAVDTAKVERIVENLLTNAVRHTPARSTIWVQVRPDGDGVLISVEDEGTGVPAELTEEIFEPFRQGPDTNRHSPGVGIGLSLVARFAELHGGKAWVENRPEGGAAFRVQIPGPPPSGRETSDGAAPW